jgi:hypothetical protein
MWTFFKSRGPNEAATAAEIIAADRARQAAKTARLREARLAKEAAEGLAHAPGEPAKAVKAKR